MPIVPVFIDTNILVYSLDKDDAVKYQKAKKILKPFYKEDRRAIISAQVLHEFTNKLFKWGFSHSEIQKITLPLTFWKVIPNTAQLFSSALVLKQKYTLSFWDSLIVAAAIKSRAKEIWTEDLNSGQVMEEVKIHNPLVG